MENLAHLLSTPARKPPKPLAYFNSLQLSEAAHVGLAREAPARPGGLLNNVKDFTMSQCRADDPLATAPRRPDNPYGLNRFPRNR
jgi:hypothetical protein